jgi:sugar phosphate isomerase/epimerase
MGASKDRMKTSPAAVPTIGTTTYGFRYQLLDERLAPSLESLVEQTRRADLVALQICENARPLALSAAAWQQVVRVASDHGVTLSLGCMTLNLHTLRRYLERAAAIPQASMLRVVLEDDSGHAASRGSIERFVEQGAVLAADAGMVLVFENHFHVPCRVLVEVAGQYPEDVVAFCVDSANSLRNWESPAQVFGILGSRAAFFHLKDYRVVGSNVGFTVTGAPLGEGDLDLQATLADIGRHPAAVVFLENWVPATGNRETDVAADAAWLGRSHASLRQALTLG